MSRFGFYKGGAFDAVLTPWYGKKDAKADLERCSGAIRAIESGDEDEQIAAFLKPGVEAAFGRLTAYMEREAGKGERK